MQHILEGTNITIYIIFQYEELELFCTTVLLGNLKYKYCNSISLKLRLLHRPRCEAGYYKECLLEEFAILLLIKFHQSIKEKVLSFKQ